MLPYIASNGTHRDPQKRNPSSVPPRGEGKKEPLSNPPNRGEEEISSQWF